MNQGQSESASIGDLKGLSPNAQVMVRTAVISAWAGLQVARREQQYLDDVVKPHISLLAPLWLSSLKEFARIRFAPDDSMNSGSSPLSNDADPSNADLDRQTLLQVSRVFTASAAPLTKGTVLPRLVVEDPGCYCRSS